MNLADFHFIRPYWLLALLPWIVIVALMARHKLQQGNWTKVCDEALLPYILQQKATKRRRLALTTGVTASLLTIIALAGPTWERLPAPVFRNDSALVVALDLSRSMDATDIKPSRLVRARYKIADILKQRKDGQTALLVYAGDAFTVTPLTDDTVTIASQLSALTTDIMPSQGSNTESALVLAVDLLKQAGLQQGHILLVTDGVDYDSTKAAVESLGAFDLSILGVGTAAGAPIQAAEGGFIKDTQGNIVVPKLDAHELSQLTVLGGGLYQTISANDRDTVALSAHFDSRIQEDSTEQSDLLLQQWVEKGPWLLVLALPLAALSFRKGLLTIACLLMLPSENGYALEWQDLWQTKDQQAYRAFKNKQYERAAELFENPDWKAAAQYKADLQELGDMKTPKTAIGFYNQGNVLAKSGRFEEAIESYEKALAIDPKLENARFNKEIVEKELEKQRQQQKPQANDQQKSDQDSEQDSQGDGDTSETNNEQQSSEQQQAPKQQGSENSQSDRGNGQDQQTAEANQDALEQDQKKLQAGPQAQTEDQDEEHDGAWAHQTDAVQPQDETQQANEQWLKRIPDDPSGLLRRKFLYQYGQRGRKSDTKEDW
ncbi:MAG: VWA domain-containing protein [Gammaproteobacteria bacterium]